MGITDWHAKGSIDQQDAQTLRSLELGEEENRLGNEKFLARMRENREKFDPEEILDPVRKESEDE